MLTIRSVALDIAAAGIPIFPVHGIHEGRCTCGKSLEECVQKSGKPQGGKHPITGPLSPYPKNEKGVPSWTRASTTDPTTIMAWFEQNPYYNIALHARAAGAMETDYDGPEGITEYERINKEHPEWFDTPVDRTGKGYHVYHLKPNDEYKGFNTKYGEVRIDDQYSVISPSHHYSGRDYTALPGHELATKKMTLPPAAYLEYLDTIRKVKVKEDSAGSKTPVASIPDVDMETARRIAVKYFADDRDTLRRLTDPTIMQPDDDRSKTLYTLACKMYKAEVPYDEFVQLLKASPYNKFRGRRDENEQITGLWAKVGAHTDVAYKALKIKYSDADNADRFNALYGENIRYAVEENMFYMWNTHYWERDTRNAVPCLIKNMVNGLIEEEEKNLDLAEAGLQEAIENKENKETIDRWKEIMAIIRAYLKKLTSSGCYENIFRRIQRDYININTSLTEFDRYPLLFNPMNKTLSVEQGKVVVLDQRREDLITRCAPVKYDPTVDTKPYLDMLKEVFNGNEKLIHHHLIVRGLGLTGIVVKALFTEVGDPDSGKSTLKNIEMGVYGEVDTGGYSKEPNIDTFLKRNHVGELRPDLVSMRAARIVFTSEANRGMMLDEEMVKKMTGEDHITARGPFMTREITYKPMYKINLMCNEAPYMSPDNEGLMSRVRIIPYPSKFVHEPNPKNPLEKKIDTEKLAYFNTPEGKSCILNAWIKGLEDYLKTYRVPDVDEITKATAAYRNELDNLKLFVDLCLLYGNAEIVKHDLYLAYKDFMREEGISDRFLIHERKFNKRIKGILEKVYPDEEVEGVDSSGDHRIWLGVCLKANTKTVFGGIREHSYT